MVLATGVVPWDWQMTDGGVLVLNARALDRMEGPTDGDRSPRG
jgi:hypothetical protein